MFLVLRAAARAEGCGIWLDAKCSELQIRAETSAETRAEPRAEKPLLRHNSPRSAYPR